MTSKPAVMERVRKRVSDLRPYERNPRRISSSALEKLKRSLQDDPELLEARPLLVNSYPGRENVVIAGNMRLRAAQALDWQELPVVVVSVPPDVEARWNLKDNNQWGDWIEDELAQMLAELNARGIDVEGLGFGDDELERLLAAAGMAVPSDDDDFDPTPPSVPETRPGDLIRLGPHRLVCGDSRDSATWELLMGSLDAAEASADALWTDPPYGVDLAAVALPSRGDPDHLAIQGDLPTEVGPLLAAVLGNADRWLRPGAPFYITGPHGSTALPFIEEIERVGWHLAQTLVWVKNAFVPGRSDYHYQHEAIYYGWKTAAPHVWLGATDQASVIDDEPEVSRMSRAELVALVRELRNARTTSVLREDRTRHNDLHPTMKPTALIRRTLANSTRRGDVILEPFAGSGSTLVAADLLGRRVAAIELEPRFCDVIARRWREMSPDHTVTRIRVGHREESPC